MIPRLPLEPLEPWISTDLHAAQLVGVTRSCVTRWRAQGIPFADADRAACKIAGRLPYEVWGELWWELCALADGPADAPAQPEQLSLMEVTAA